MNIIIIIIILTQTHICVYQQQYFIDIELVDKSIIKLINLLIWNITFKLQTELCHVIMHSRFDKQHRRCGISLQQNCSAKGNQWSCWCSEFSNFDSGCQSSTIV